MKENFEACYEITLGAEGGYSDDPNDPGNWTGCEPGKGTLKGTMKGISACAYPTLDIANLTDAEIEALYRNDYWAPVAGDELPWGVDLATWDAGVNSGPGRGVQWLQQAMGMPASEVDGAMGPVTLGYVGQITDPHGVIDGICDNRLAFLRTLDTWSLYGQGWSNRVAEIRTDAHGMASDHEDRAPQPTPEPEPAPEPPQLVAITITIAVPPGVSVTVATTPPG